GGTRKGDAWRDSVPRRLAQHLAPEDFPMTDSSRVRVSIVGVVVVALFSTLLARLWFLQSGAESSLKVQAAVAATRVIQTQSPRGEILDRNGVVLVKDRPSWAVSVDRDLSARTAK